MTHNNSKVGESKFQQKGQRRRVKGNILKAIS
jgi:hypothetical protein